MENTTYSFTDAVGSMSHPTIGDYIFTGKGVGSATIAKATERTTHDVAADGSVMVSKVAGNNGTVTIEVQQSSPLHRFLQKWFNALVLLPSSEWATTILLLKSPTTGMSHKCTGVSPQKDADNPYQAQGARVTWVLMAADIQNDVI